MQLHNISDLAIWGAYLAIPVVLLFFAYKQRTVPFRYLFILFGMFIVACGFTHFMDYYTFTTPMYRLAGLIKVITALVSWGTVIALIPVTPVALQMKSPQELERLVDERTRELEERSQMLRLTNEQLQREVDERRRVEQLLLQKQEEILELNAGLEQRVQERTAALESSNHELEAFCYSVSHDLRGPLRAIDGFSFALQEEAGPQMSVENVEYLARIRTASRRMDVLITSLLKLSRLTRAEIRRERINASEVAWSVLSELRQLDPERQIELKVQPEVLVDADLNLLRVLLTNLLGNAWKFTSRSPEPVIEFGREDGELFVRDNGAGFEMEYANKLFQPFERLHNQEDFPGSGIGLATVERVVRNHGGRVRAVGQAGKGATFYFTLGG